MNPKLKISVVLMLALSLAWVAGANAQLTVFNSNVPAGFTQMGIIEQATLNAGGANAGGTLTINGIKMIVPANSVIQMPANTFTWAQLFNLAVSAAVYDNAIVPKPVIPNHRPGITGLALLDNPFRGTRPGSTAATLPFLPFNAIVLGNIDVKNALGFGVGAYIVGLILPINQDLGNLGQGFISYIDYAKGRFEIGGTLNVPNTGTIIEINDPLGRYGLAHSPDPRWSVDSENPTVTSGNGYPMGIAKVAPPAIDPDRPVYNRPLNPAAPDPNHDPFLQVGAPFMAFFMPPKAAPNAPGDTTPDPWKQAPFMVGDMVSFAGTLCLLNPRLPLNPAIPINRQTYISANTVSSDKLAMYTDPGPLATAGPCYLQLFKTKIGNGGTSITMPPQATVPPIDGGIIPIIEPRQNIVIRGWVTDSTAIVDIYALDFPFGAGAPTPRLLGSILPEPGFVAGKGNKGRFRFDIGKGNFLPATRMYMVQSRHGQVQLPPQVGLNGAPLPGLQSGQYSVPNFDYQFADAPPGFPNVPNNFQDIPFLFGGEGATLPLSPFPPFAP